MGSRHEKDKDKGVNVQVLLRCRPFSEDELKANAPQVISCHDHRREVTVVQNIASKQIDRTFTFDKVFGPQSQQRDLYDQAVIPIVNEVLEGFNCTIFAYGQTGTGKTYTMEGGGRKAKSGELPADAGVIPRAVQQIFDTLESQNAEYSVKVTFLELYNEEITDLLAPEEFSKVIIDDKQRKPLALMEDGKGGVLVRGLDEEIVTSANEIYNLLDRGSAKRRTAETLLNKQSSRSHSIFSITIHIKEASPEGEELIKCGKLNLVDLAGSENICRSGAREGRAREAGEINKSLLTLGRVITALVEHLGHIPYRDSKLTRLLRDSLGGRTKTCIIATVSPSVHCLEETLSTLDYAHRAKSIKNKPEVNQKMMKSALIKDLYGEIERLKSEVYAAREKNGVYVPRDRYFQEEADKKAMAERIEHMEYELESKEKQLDEMQEISDSQQKLNLELRAKLDKTQKLLDKTEEAFVQAKCKIEKAQYTIKEREYIIKNQHQAEHLLIEQACNLRSQLESTAKDIEGLCAKIERKEVVEAGNESLVKKFQLELAAQMRLLNSTIMVFATEQQGDLQNMECELQRLMGQKNEAVEELKKKLQHMKSTYSSQFKCVNDVVNEHGTLAACTFQNINSSVSAHVSMLDNLLEVALSEADAVLNDLQEVLSDQQREIAAFAQQQRELGRKSTESASIISKAMLELFVNLEKNVSALGQYVDCCQEARDKSLTELQESYENRARQEEQQLLQGITSLLASSMAHTKELVFARVRSLREISSKEAESLKAEMIKAQEVTSDGQGRLEAFMKEAEANAVEASSLLAAKHCRMEELLQHSVMDTSIVGEQWTRSINSLRQLERDHFPAVSSIVQEGLEANQLLGAQLRQVDDAAQLEFEANDNSIVIFVDDMSKTEGNALSAIQRSITSHSNAVKSLEQGHDSHLTDVQRLAHTYFNEQYLEDKPTSTTPTKRDIDIPSQEAIDGLRTPAVESLVEEFRQKNSPKRKNYAESEQIASKEAKVSAEHSIKRESRIPLTTIN
ncbi:hypothetical protein O6H91_02G045100 [Diphasiastrum complanatum]|uniref:Uncharacterized protein n=1 Tax=Diphasiastrum complanatum TaxID=34168 RepID=A0ACC2EEQ4_DIPCM|nr:hypothetical protein O6H91_02G045100 [Diphasiastrum complanatum]